MKDIKEKFSEVMEEVIKKGIEDIPYEETLDILEKHSLEIITQEARDNSHE